MPQWDFLNFLMSHAKRFRNFRLLMETDMDGLIVENDRIAGVQATTPQGPLTIRADLVVGADGRHSTVREQAHLVPETFGVPIDVLWMRLPKYPGDENEALGRVAAGNILVTLDRGDYWQCALVIAKGGAQALRSLGLDAFRKLLVRIAPMFADRVQTLTDWDQIKLLTVTVDRLPQWCKPGLLCIGDAAHAMSPIGGVGINLAVQDAVAAANILAEKLRTGAPSLSDLYRVQRRRELPARLIQWIQIAIQDRIMTRVLRLQRDPEPPLLLKIFNAVPFLRRIPARVVGMGFRPEHVRTAQWPPP
jgi:2-polyprenyl-6-methoxyphenol hydroxylase-like FAD-dependent oxidoreductase